ncbi:MAG TPA: undecaprenyl-diphosphate phosphatase, partial [Lachnospiraceae bacterium]
LYFEKLWPFCNKREIRFDEIKTRGNRQVVSRMTYFSERYIQKDKFLLWVKILLSCLPAIFVGLPLDDWLEKHFYNYVVVALMLIIYGVLFIFVENHNKKRRPRAKRLSEISWKMALGIGVFQLLSLIPGTSRSGATILGGILLGASRKLAAEYTFFLAVPVMFGASLLKVVKYGLVFSGGEIALLLVGMISAFLVSIFAIKFLMGYIRKHNFKVFGYYRIILGCIVLLYFAVKTFLS